MPDAPALSRGALAGTIQARLYGPPIEALLGIRPHVPGSDVRPPAFEPCARCGAIRDEAGKVLWVRSVRADGTCTVRPTGIQEGDALACISCQCLSPADERGRGTQGKPPQDEQKRRDRPPARLTEKDRRSLGRDAVGRCWLALRDAEDAGQHERAGRLQTLLFRHRDREIDDAELDRQAGETLGIT